MKNLIILVVLLIMAVGCKPECSHEVAVPTDAEVLSE